MRVNTRNQLIVILIIAFVFGAYIGITELKEKKADIPKNNVIEEPNTDKPSIIDEIDKARYTANKSSAMVLLKKIEQQLIIGNYSPSEALVITNGKIDNSSIKVNIEFDADLKVGLNDSVDGTIIIKGDTFKIVKNEIVE